jgi:hypothetical protein
MPDLSERIREYVDEVERPVTLDDVWPVLRHNQPRRRRSRPAFVLGGAVAVAAAALLVVVVLPNASNTQVHQPVAPAAQLRQIAARAAGQPISSLNADQWLQTRQTVAFSAQVTEVGTTPTPEAQASVQATINTWSNTNGQACVSVSASADPARFQGPSNEAAWKAAGLSDTPVNQPIPGCTTITTDENQPSGSAANTDVIDVWGLPTNASVLAHQLTTGTTGILKLDRLTTDGDQNLGFERAAILLVGPDAGVGPEFSSELYRALAMMSGIRSLGTVKTHTGLNGKGFSAETSSGQSTIVVDPASGTLLEARDLHDQALFSAIAESYVTQAVAGISTDRGSWNATIRWLDPLGMTTVVNNQTLPASTDVAIFATAQTSATYSQLNAFIGELDTRLGRPLGGFTYSGPSVQVENQHAPPPTSADGNTVRAGATMQWTFGTASQQLQQYLTALRSSGMFVSVIPI